MAEQANGNCGCLDRIDQLLLDGGHNTKLKRSFWMGDRIGMTVCIKSEKIEKSSKPATSIKPTYCPFCGVKYGEARHG